MSLLDLRSLEEQAQFTGTIGVEYLYDDVTGQLLVDDTTGAPLSRDGANLGAQTWGFTLAAAGAQSFSATSGLVFGWSESDTGEERFSGPLALAFGWSESGSAKETVTGSATLAFGFTESDTGEERFSGPAALAFGWSESASGTVSSTTITGTGSLTFGWSEAASGANASIQDGHHAVGRGLRRVVQKPLEIERPAPIEGEGGLVFGFSLHVTASTNDDDLAILLAA